MRLDHLLSMETGTDFHGSVIRVNDEDRSTESASTDLLLFNLQGSDRESGRIFESKAHGMGV